MEGSSSSNVVDAMAGLNLGSGGAGPSASRPSAGDGAALPLSSAAAANNSGSTVPGAGVVVGPNCQLCDKEMAGPPKLCGGCGTVGYCSKECQKADWKVHKHLCEPSRLWRAALATGVLPPNRSKIDRVKGSLVLYRLTDDELAGLTDAQRVCSDVALKELAAICLTCSGPLEQHAISRLVTLLSTLKDAVGRDHLINLPVLAQLSTALYVQGKHDDAYQYCLRALTIFEARFGPSDPGIVELLVTLINIQRCMSKYDEVLVHAQRCLALGVLHYGPKSDAAAASLGRLADCLACLNRLGDAVGLYRLVLAMNAQLFGSDSEAVVESMLNLATFYVNSADDFAAAEPLLKDALAKIERLTKAGVDGLNFSRATMHNLYAGCLAHRGDYVAAAEHEQLVLDFKVAQFGGRHIMVGHALITLAGTQARLERWAQAETNYRRGAQIVKDHDDPDDDKTLAGALKSADICREAVVELARGAGGARGRRAPGPRGNQRG